jgi:chemotaxis protein histidine kinase CheA
LFFLFHKFFSPNEPKRLVLRIYRKTRILNSFESRNDFREKYQMSLREFLEFLANPFRFSNKPETDLSGLFEGIETVLNELSILQERTKQMALNLDALTAEVERVKSVQESAVTLLHALSDELTKIATDLHECGLGKEGDLEALDALVEKLKGSTDGLATAIAESDDYFEVPAEETPTEEPVAEEPVAEEPVEEPVEEVVEEAPVEEEVPAEEVVEAPAEEAPVAEETPEAPFDASGIPGLEGTQSGPAVEKEDKPLE